MDDMSSDWAAQTVQYRRRYLQFLSILGLGVVAVIIPLNLAWNLDGAAAACVLYAPICIIVIWGSRWKGELLNVFVNIFILATLLITLGGIFFQRSDALVDPWILTCPVVSFALCKRQVAILWTILTLLALFAIRQTAPYSPAMPSTIFLSLAVVAISIVLYAFSAQIERNERLIVELGNTDSLTGTLNRRSFSEVLQSEFRRNNRVKSSMTVFMADVDFFKAYNDRYGHVAGDNVLTHIADALKQTAKRSGDFVFRYGGEEFCILCSGLDSEQATAFAEQLRTNVEALAIEHEDSPFGKISISIGYRHANILAPLTPFLFVEEADKALYFAKASGRNRVENYLSA